MEKCFAPFFTSLPELFFSLSNHQILSKLADVALCLASFATHRVNATPAGEVSGSALQPCWRSLGQLAAAGSATAFWFAHRAIMSTSSTIMSL